MHRQCFFASIARDLIQPQVQSVIGEQNNTSNPDNKLQVVRTGENTICDWRRTKH